MSRFFHLSPRSVVALISPGVASGLVATCSLAQTCKHWQNPFVYLRDVIERVSTHPARLVLELTPASGSACGTTPAREPPPKQGLGAGHWCVVPRSQFAQYGARLQLVEQCLGVFQVRGVEALGEPAVNLGEHCARLFAMALFRVQPRETRDGA